MEAGYANCIVDLNCDSKITSANKGFEEMFGYSEDDILNKQLTCRSLVVRGINNGGFKSLMVNTVNNGLAYEKYLMRRKDGTTLFVSCVAENCHDGKMEIKMKECNEKKVVEKCDSLTGFYTCEAAFEEIKRIDKENEYKDLAFVVMKLLGTAEMDKAYGTVYTDAIIENIGSYINHFYCRKLVKCVVARLCRDSFMICIAGESKDRVKNMVRWAYKNMFKSYYGRLKQFEFSVPVGVYFMDENDKDDYGSALKKAGAAMEYAIEKNTGTAEYNESMDSYISRLFERFSGVDEDGSVHIYDYDNRFVAFAVSLLANSLDRDSSQDLLIQRMAWRYGFDGIVICKFEDGHYIHCINKFVRGTGIIENVNELYDINEWKNFIGSFGKDGIAVIKNTNDDCFSELEKQFFKSVQIGSAINFLFKSGDTPVGYASCCFKKPNRTLDKRSMSTMIQLAKIMEISFNSRLHEEEEAKKVRSLSRDTVTGLYIMPAFTKKAEEILEDADPSKCYAIIHSDIDYFSYFNTNYGYETGNSILKLFAQRLKKVCEKGGIAGHIEADNYISLLIRDSEEEIEKDIHEFDRSFKNINIGTRVISSIRVSSGVCLIEPGKADLKGAIYNANLVWKYVKNKKFSDYKVYDDSFRSDHEYRLNVVGSIKGAIARGEIVTFLQPKFSMNNMEVVGAEALCRWQNPNGTYKSPIEFLPILEEEGQIVDVDYEILEQTLSALSHWKNAGKKLIPISVNFSRVHVNTGRFSEKIIELVKKYDVDPKYIDIEITESAISSQDEVMLSCMKELQENGFKMEMDDFGTGSSSLNMLIETPVDIVKVDKSFIDKWSSPVHRAYIGKIGALIETAQKEIIFEGVETDDQMRFLMNCGYDMAQGYVFSKPVPLKEFERKYVYA